jgi:uncharacterized protein (TIGR00255 family)
MIKGMTGFGSAQWSSGKIKALVEVKSLNHRYFDITYYLPVGFGAIEDKIRQLAQKYIERGRVTISIKVTQKPTQEVVLNKEAVRKYLQYIRILGKEFHLENDVRLSDIIQLPAVLDVKEMSMDTEAMWPSIERCLRSALKGLEEMRKREGRSMAADVNDKLKRMSLQIEKIQLKTSAILSEKREISSVEEFQSFRKNCDINEEVSRLIHFINEAKLLLGGRVSAGKKIDFIAQEMQRETNTIGAKLPDKEIVNAVVALKGKIEKIREQAQNIE